MGGRIHHQRRRDRLRHKVGATENTANQWYSWTGSAWNAGADPLRSTLPPPRHPRPRQLQPPLPRQPRPCRPTTPSCAPARQPRSPMPPATAGRYRPPTSSWRTDRRPHSPRTSPRLPTLISLCGRRTRAINGTAGPGQDGAPAMIPCRSQPRRQHPHRSQPPRPQLPRRSQPQLQSNPHSDANPDRVTQRHRRARRLDRRDHRCRRQPLDNIVHQRRPGQRTGGCVQRERRRDCLRWQYCVAGEHE